MPHAPPTCPVPLSEALYEDENEANFIEDIVYKKADWEAAGVKDLKVAKVDKDENTQGDASELIWGGRGGNAGGAATRWSFGRRIRTTRTTPSPSPVSGARLSAAKA